MRIVWNNGVLYDTFCDKLLQLFCCIICCCELKFFLHFKHCLKEPSINNAIEDSLLQYIQIFDNIGFIDFIDELKSNAFNIDVWWIWF